MGSIVDASEVWLELGLSGSITDEERAVVEQCVTKAEGAIKRHLRYDPVLRRRTEYYPRYDLGLGVAESIWEVSDSAAYIRQQAGAQTSELQLRHIPVRSLPAMDVRVDYDGRSGTAAGAFGMSTVQTEGEDFWANYDMVDSDGTKLCQDGLLRSMGAWPLAAGTIRIEYTAGYSNAELHGEHADDVDVVLDASPIWEAVIEETKRRVEQIMVRKKSSVGWVAGPKSSESLGDYSYSVDSSLAKSLYGNTAALADQSMLLLERFVNMGWDT